MGKWLFSAPAVTCSSHAVKRNCPDNSILPCWDEDGGAEVSTVQNNPLDTSVVVDRPESGDFGPDE